jgi:hypothetical protein
MLIHHSKDVFFSALKRYMTCHAIYLQKARTRSKGIDGSDRLTGGCVCLRVNINSCKSLSGYFCGWSGRGVVLISLPSSVRVKERVELCFHSPPPCAFVAGHSLTFTLTPTPFTHLPTSTCLTHFLANFSISCDRLMQFSKDSVKSRSSMCKFLHFPVRSSHVCQHSVCR